jgi:hypothetical protein
MVVICDHEDLEFEDLSTGPEIKSEIRIQPHRKLHSHNTSNKKMRQELVN